MVCRQTEMADMQNEYADCVNIATHASYFIVHVGMVWWRVLLDQHPIAVFFASVSTTCCSVDLSLSLFVHTRFDEHCLSDQVCPDQQCNDPSKAGRSSALTTPLTASQYLNEESITPDSANSGCTMDGLLPGQDTAPISRCNIHSQGRGQQSRGLVC